MLEVPFTWNCLPQECSNKLPPFPTTEKVPPRLKSSSHLIEHNNRTRPVKLWQLEWGKISHNYEWDLKFLTWNTLLHPYHRRKVLWKLLENSSERNLRETWQVLMTQQLRISNKVVFQRDLEGWIIITDVKVRPRPRRWYPIFRYQTSGIGSVETFPCCFVSHHKSVLLSLAVWKISTFFFF